MQRLILSLCLSLMSAGGAFAQDWTRFRGPNGSGASETANIPAQWTDADFKWKIALPGEGHSSPVVWKDHVYLMSAEPESAVRYVLAINTKDGSTAWKVQSPAKPHHLHAKSSYASVTPAVDAEGVLAAWSDPEHTWLVAFDHQGNRKWQADLGGWIGQHGFGTSPVLIDDLVVITSSQEPEKRAGAASPTECFIAAYDRKSGERRWRIDRKIDTASYSVPCVRKNAKGETELIFLSTAEGIFALDPKSGKEKWSSGPVFSMRTVSSPVLWKDLIYGTTGSGAGGNYIVAYRPGDSAPAFEIKKEMPYVPTPVVYGDLMFLWSDKGIVTCIDPASGNQVWQKRVGGGFSGSPIRVGNKLFCVDEAGTVVVLAAADKFEELGRNPLNEKSHSTPAVADGVMYVRTVSHLFAIGGKKS